MELPVRKHPRLDEYDYSQNGYYFITICVKDRRKILSNISFVGRDAHIPPKVILTDIGTIVDEYIGNINKAYNNIAVDSYVIMPDHIHLLVSIDEFSAGGMKASRPTLNTVVRSLKTMVTKKIGYSIWQSSYYDHIIRNKEDLFETRKYIENNPIR